MRLKRGKSENFCLLVLIGAWLIMPAGLVDAGPNDGRFSVVGWVKDKLTPEENARSASRSQRLRPMPVNLNQAPAPQSQSSAQGMAMAATSPQLASYHSPSPASQPIALPPIQRSAPPLPGPNPESIGNGRSSGPPPSSRRENSRSPSSNGERSVEELRRRAEFLASKGLTYKFGGDHPSEGGMDCSGTMQFLLKSMGYPDIPRTSYNQYSWLQEKGTLRKVGFFHSADRAIKNLRPGDLIFWGGTYDSGHKVSHVMIYMGKSRNGTHYIFGARGKKVKGLNGSGVDIFEYNPKSTGGRLIGYGHLPGLKG